MKDVSRDQYGAAAGAVAVALFLTSGLVIGEQPAFGAPGAEVAAHLDDARTRIQVGCAFAAAAMPFLVWFLATVVSVTRGGTVRTQRAVTVAYGCGLIFIALFLADVTSLAVSALRTDNMAASAELASALRDFEWLLMGMAAPMGSAVLVAFAVLVLRDRAIWPQWLGWLAAIAAPAYALRIGTLFTTEGIFAADGVLGLYVPVVALAGWILLASVAFALRVRRTQGRDQLLRSAC
jgi:hypothetical protein